MIVILEISEIKADRDLDFHCTDSVRSMIQDGCRNLQRFLKQRAAEARKKKLEQHQQIMNGRGKRENNDVLEHLNSTQNDNNFVDDDYDDEDANFSVQFLENECKYQFTGNIWNSIKMLRLQLELELDEVKDINFGKTPRKKDQSKQF